MKKLVLAIKVIFLIAASAMAQGGFYEAYDYNRWLSEFAITGAMLTTSGSRFVSGRGREVEAAQIDMTQSDDWIVDFFYEGRRARWMILAGGARAVSANADAQPELSSSRRFAEAAIGLMPMGEGFYLLTGGRFNDVDIQVGGADDKSSALINGDRQWLDPFAGMRLDLGLFEWLAIRLYGDIGGFGVSSNTSWNASTSLRWRLGGFVLQAGYKINRIDFESDEEIPFKYDILTKSPSIGLSYSF